MIALANNPVFAQRQSPIAAAVVCARAAQQDWASLSMEDRARRIGIVRGLLAERATALAQEAAAVQGRPIAEKLVSEVLPLVEACRFLEKNAGRILRTTRFGRRGRPLWLRGHSFEVQRKPHGVVLIVGPSNYPLFLPAVQALHALAAGNAVLLKPAEGASEPLALFVELVTSANVAPELMQLLPDDVEAGIEAARCGVDKAIFTGSSQNGRAFLRELARTNTPSVMELSGADFVYLRADADVERAVKAIAFGGELNGGNTCMAPQTIVAHRALAPWLKGLPVIAVKDDEEAVALIAAGEHGLGAAIFSRNETAARALAARLPIGFVTINDLIVPTADPRFPFGGVRGSGFGVTRGAEGLLEMTYPHAVAVRRARSLPHLEAPHPVDAQLFSAFIKVNHARGWRVRLSALYDLWGAVRARSKS